jgi:hypothetical protein
VTEIHHATHALLAPAALVPPPRIEVGATAQPRPVPSAHHGDGSTRLSTRTGVEGCATTGAELHPAQRAHQSYGHCRPAMSHSRPLHGELPYAACTFAACKGGCAARGTSRRAAGTQHHCSFAGSVRGMRP